MCRPFSSACSILNRPAPVCLGERIFTQRGCARCHGFHAEGTTEGPRLEPGTDAFTPVSLTSTLWNHGPGMSARAQRMGAASPALEGTDLGDLTSFLNDSGRMK